MRTRWLLPAVAMGLVWAGSLGADLKRAQAEPNLEKRSQLAMDNAMAAYQAARSAYDKGDNPQTEAAIAEIEESVDLADTSLRQTGKDPRKSSKWFKRAEMETRDLVRKLQSFQDSMGFDDRPMLDKVKARVQQVHDDLLLGIMEGKHK
ncbi:MAG TPA: hypothetical protein VMH81_09265 [Bryobacteraceae bacterium]|nr:hypothetical protein [Bryobacteraceae bacterium]